MKQARVVHWYRLLPASVANIGRTVAVSKAPHGSISGLETTVAESLLSEMLYDTKFAPKEMPISWFGDVGFFYQF